MTFSLDRQWNGSFAEPGVVFNGTDRDDYDTVLLRSDDTASTPYGYTMVNGGVASAFFGSTNAPTTSYTQQMWCRVQYDGTTVKTWQVVKSSAPTETEWASSATQTISSTGCRSTGGRLGFLQPHGGYPALVGNVTIKSYNSGTSAFDVTEATEDFSVDGSGYASSNITLSSDANGNQTYDGVQAYTYDAWNRLKTVAHGYGTGSSHGQVFDTMSYDAKGRRIIKAVSNTGSWDCTYNYYLDRDSVVEEQNGSGTAIKQFVWGKQYIDELLQTSLNSSPMIETSCDRHYWSCQDANWNVLGIVDADGVLKERYEYSPYGQRTVFFSPGTNDLYCTAPTAASVRWYDGDYDVTEPWGLCEVGHQGLMHDAEDSLVYNRTRYVSHTNIFVSRDQIDELRLPDVTSIEAVTNENHINVANTAAVHRQYPGKYIDGVCQYLYLAGNPISGIDPMGLDRYITGCGGHHGIAVDTWTVTPTGWVSTGVVSYDFAADYRVGPFLLGAVFCGCSGRLSGPASGFSCPVIETIPSSPAADLLLKGNLDAATHNPPIYHVLFNNCRDFAAGHKNDGLNPPQCAHGHWEHESLPDTAYMWVCDD